MTSLKNSSRIRGFFTVLLLIAAIIGTPSNVNAQDQADTNPEKASNVVGVISGDAPKEAESLRQDIAKKVDSKSEYFANKSGVLSVHKNLTRAKLRELATWLGRQKGVRLALHDTPRRMILLIFESAAEDITPDAVAAPLEKIRTRFLKAQKRKVAQPELGADDSKIEPLPGADVKELTDPNSGDNSKNKPGSEKTDPETSKTDVEQPVGVNDIPKATPPNREQPETEPNEPKTPEIPKKLDEPDVDIPEAKVTADSFKPYAKCDPPITENAVKSVKLFGEITGRAALKLWFEGKHRARAVAVARKALKRNKTDWDAGVVTALFHLQSGNKLTAYRNMRTIVFRKPHIGLYHDIYAEVLDAMSLGDQAREARAKAQDLGVDSYIERLGLK